MICTQCGEPALQFTISDTYLIRCPACAFCWMADDTVTRLRECFDAKTVHAFEATVRELKRKAKGASDAVLIGLTAELGRAEDLLFDGPPDAAAVEKGHISDQLQALGEEFLARAKAGGPDDVDINQRAVRLLDAALAIADDEQARRLRNAVLQRIEHLTPPSDATAAMLRETLAGKPKGGAT